VENRQFEPTHLCLELPTEVTPLEFRRYFWHQKIRVPGLSCGVVCQLCLFLSLGFSRFGIQCWLVTDRQTDRRTVTR